MASGRATEAASGRATEAASGDHPAQVDVEVIADGSTLLITVADSGPGIGYPDPDRVFVEGVTTHDDTAIPGGRGMGLALSRQLARQLGGDLVVGDPGGDHRPPRQHTRWRRVRRPAPRPRHGSHIMTEFGVLIVDDDFRVAGLHASIVNAVAGFTVTAQVGTRAAALEAPDHPSRHRPRARRRPSAGRPGSGPRCRG